MGSEYFFGVMGFNFARKVFWVLAFFLGAGGRLPKARRERVFIAYYYCYLFPPRIFFCVFVLFGGCFCAFGFFFSFLFRALARKKNVFRRWNEQTREFPL